MQILAFLWKSSKDYVRKNRIWLRFFLITLILAGAAWYVLYLDWIKINIVIPYATLIARSCGKLLQFLISDVQVQQSIVRQPQGFAMIIGAKCTGLFQIAFLVAGIVATPAKAIQKLSGIIVGTIVVSGINMLRLLSIFLVGYYALPYLDVFHDIIWEALMIALTFFTWYVWRRMAIMRTNLYPVKSR